MVFNLECSLESPGSFKNPNAPAVAQINHIRIAGVIPTYFQRTPKFENHCLTGLETAYGSKLGRILEIQKSTDCGKLSYVELI